MEMFKERLKYSSMHEVLEVTQHPSVWEKKLPLVFDLSWTILLDLVHYTYKNLLLPQESFSEAHEREYFTNQQFLRVLMQTIDN